MIVVFDNGLGKVFGVFEFKYGYRVIVIGIVCLLRWMEILKGLEVGGL